MTDIAVISSSIHPAGPFGRYGSEPQNVVLCRALESLGHKVTLYAPRGSIKTTNWRPIPGGFGQANPNDEMVGYDRWREELLKHEFVVDNSGCHIWTEQFFFYDRDVFKGVWVWTHNGNVLTSPRYPIPQRVHGTLYSKAQRANAFAHYPWAREIPTEETVHILPYGIDESYFTPGPGNGGYFLYLSRPVKDKGIGEFLELAKDRPDERFVMAFDYDAAPDHRKQGLEAIEKAKGIPNLTYTPLNGSQEKKLELYQHAKAVVTPLDKDYLEGMGLVNLEALACGTPVITASHGGQVEIWEEWKGEPVAFEVDAASEGAHGAYLEALDSAHTLSRQSCRDLIMSDFTREAYAKRYLSLFEELKR